ncbi:MAG TPA: VOC family protein [Gemmatimonadaceae bacterium]|nr:VOC family protein [Gemmatimonadaceae bacterium]
MTTASAPVGNDINLRSAAPTFLASDVARTVDWYEENLGFKLAGHFPNEAPYAYASIVRGPVEVMLLSMTDYKKPDLSRPNGLWEAYIRMDGVRALYETVAGKPFVQMELKQQPYNDWEFEVRDPNGYVLVFGGSY